MTDKTLAMSDITELELASAIKAVGTGNSSPVFIAREMLAHIAAARAEAGKWVTGAFYAEWLHNASDASVPAMWYRNNDGWYSYLSKQVFADGQVDTDGFELMRRAPHRYDDVVQWVKDARDGFDGDDAGWVMLDSLLDDYRLHADTGAPLGRECPER